MIICIDNILNSEELKLIHSKLTNSEFRDGKETAGWYAKEVKNNLQLPSNELTEEMRSIVMQALQRNRLFQAAVRPKIIRPIIFSRYEPGMYYGYHTDNALMGNEVLTRSDVSLTLFLSSPSSYVGGELMIDTSLGEQVFKLEAGSMIVYPSSTLHQVTTVTEGTRFAAISWVQSIIRDPGEREILFDLETAREALFQKHGITPEFDLICKTHANLLRKWADI
ncbi:Fe2+-dependent dioxygenase [Brasilonema octagenarum]|uniref:Fe2+-dependent dioxygenase n=1 Tax=Brasilonema octagenarum UFV-OR1 TaxID=417115 RepID=A0ABX1M4E5_9CYAN|nr:Fe2+-dependent dioxygenase [Brasilonema octagenarum]NMF63398.1 Fe2+-dependent dioxygenase [Brasilonema octagenarum UFV-OR1]